MSKIPKRQNKGKPRFSLLSQRDLEPGARAMENGITKYGRGSYKDCIKHGTDGWDFHGLIDSLERHLDCIKEGEHYDKDSGVHHIGGIQANAMFLGYWLREVAKMEATNDEFVPFTKSDSVEVIKE